MALVDTVSTTTGVIDELHRVSSEGYRFVDRINTVKHYRGGWLTVLSPTSEEIALAEDLLDDSLSSVDTKCIAIAETRKLRLVTDDGHVGEIASQRGVEVWDLKLLIQAAVLRDHLASKRELRTVITDLHEKDFYRFRRAMNKSCTSRSIPRKNPTNPNLMGASGSYDRRLPVGSQSSVESVTRGCS